MKSLPCANVPFPRKVRVVTLPFFVTLVSAGGLLTGCLTGNTPENNFSDLARKAGATPPSAPTPAATMAPEQVTPTPEPTPATSSAIQNDPVLSPNTAPVKKKISRKPSPK